MELIHHLKYAKYIQSSYILLGYMAWRGNAASVFLVNHPKWVVHTCLGVCNSAFAMQLDAPRITTIVP
jgi:hypothetical protein